MLTDVTPAHIGHDLMLERHLPGLDVAGCGS